MIWLQLHLQVTGHYTTFCTRHARQMGMVYSAISIMIWWSQVHLQLILDLTLHHVLHMPCKTSGVWFKIYSMISTMIWWSQLHLQLTWHIMFCTRHARQIRYGLQHNILYQQWSDDHSCICSWSLTWHYTTFCIRHARQIRYDLQHNINNELMMITAAFVAELTPHVIHHVCTHHARQTGWGLSEGRDCCMFIYNDSI